MKKIPHRSSPRRAIAGLALSLMIGGAPMVLAAVTDPFSAALPARDAKRPEGTKFAGGSGSVADRVGSAGYGFPIELPAGRNGMKPSLALSYSSGGALRGGVAVGWSLELPTIERDPGFPTEERFRAGSARLLVVNPTDPAGGVGYRAEVDSGFTHYVRSPGLPDGYWRALSPDGVVREFYETGAARWYLSKERDPFGNTVAYSYEVVQSGGFTDRMPKTIEYTSNASAGLGPHARVEFVYAPLETCGGTPIGAGVDYHFGLRRWTASRRLSEIRVSVKDGVGDANTAILAGNGPSQLAWRRARTYTLSYDQAELACAGPALRYLTQIDVAAYNALGVETKAPPVRLTYGPKNRDLSRTLTVANVPREEGDMSGPKTGFLDMNGDGRLDFVEVRTEDKCRMAWRQGLGNGQFAAAETTFALPTAAWENGFYPNHREYCRLTGQKVTRPNPPSSIKFCYTSLGIEVRYHFVDFDGDGRVDLLTSIAGNADDAGGDFVSSTDGMLFLNSASGVDGSNGGCPSGMDKIGEIDGVPNCTCHSMSEVYDRVLGNCRPECPFGTYMNVITGQCDIGDGDCFGGCPPPPTGGAPNPDVPSCSILPMLPERAGTGFVWRVQRNFGDRFAPLGGETIDGQINRDSWKIFSPVPLPSGGNETHVASTMDGPTPGIPALVDITGDGYLDAISFSSTDPLGSYRPGERRELYVWPGDGQGFHEEQTWTFRIPPGAEQPWFQAFEKAAEIDIPGGRQFNTPSTLAFRDVNSDGLPDFVVQAGDVISVAYNMAGAKSAGQLPGGAFSELVPMGFSSPVGETRAELTKWLEFEDLRIVTGTRAFLRRLVDVDADGYQELVMLTPQQSVSRAASLRHAWRIVGGGTFVDWPATLGAEWEPIEGLVSALDGQWTRKSDFIDLTGDGLPDAVTWNPDGTATIRTDGAVIPTVSGPKINAAGPLRLLTSIDNGRGGVTRFDYALSTDTSIVTLGPDARALSPRWVVARVVESPGFGQPDLSTSYHYEQPVFGVDSALDLGAPHFRGFSKVTTETSGQQGSASRQVVKKYDYTRRLHRDYGPWLETELSSMKVGDSWVPAQHREFYYGAGTLFAGQVSFTYQSHHFERTCAPFATKESCASEATNRKVTSETWTPFTPALAPGPALFLHSETRESIPGEPSPRYTKREYQIRYGISASGVFENRLLETKMERGRVYTLYSFRGTQTKLLPWARTVTVWNAAGLPEETRVYKDNTNFVTTKRAFDTQTGNVTSVIMPNQVAAAQTNAETYTYDAYRLRVSTTTNQSYNTVTDTFDVATGALLRRVGPSFRLVDPPGGCWWFCWNPVYEAEGWIVDGFGRVLEHYDSLDPAPGVQGYDYRLVETASYLDHELPNRRVVSKLRDRNPAATAAWVIDEERYDGSGRVTSATARRPRPEQCDAVTTYEYDASGELRQITSPNPASDCQMVATTFDRDGLGRPTALARPDGSGKTIRYLGLDTEVLETSALEGPGARTTLRKNPYGELIEVQEHDNPEPGQTAITKYVYDPLGRMTTITDADRNLTTMAYDWRGLRTAVTRGARTWTYKYDANGNMTEQNDPLPPGGLLENYRSTTQYDMLDRPFLHTPANRELTDPARRAQLGIGPVTTSYNWGDAIGRPWVISLPFGTITLSYTATGQVKREQRALNLNQGVSVSSTQWVERRYDELGNPTNVKWDDGSEWSYAYDARGAVTDVSWRNPAGGENVVLAHYDRRAAGQPYRRTSSYSSQHREWQYDVLGRVTYDWIWRPTDSQTYHERVYGYDGYGELNVVQGTTNGMRADATIDYDKRHRVKRVQGPIGGYNAAFTYTGAGNVQTAAVAGAADVPNRNVRYSYGVVDPQAVDRLTDVLTHAEVGSFGYDLAGNLVRRNLSGREHTFAFDSDGMLREASGPSGIERYFFGPGAERMASIGPEGVKVWFGESETLFTSSGAQVRRYHHIAAGEPIARVENRTSVELQYADTLQNLVLSVHQNGSVMAAFVYGAFGEVVGSLDATSHRRRFNGKEHDAVSGLRHYGYRSYDPVTMRWVSADPLYRLSPDMAWAEPQRANLYAFTGNNPLRFFDPDGRETKGPGPDTRTPPSIGPTEVRAEIPGEFVVLSDGRKVPRGSRAHLQHVVGITCTGLFECGSEFEQVMGSPQSAVAYGTAKALGGSEQQAVAAAGAASALAGIAVAVAQTVKGVPNVQRVFWSGGKSAEAAAEAFARRTGGTTLEMTEAYKQLDMATRSLPFEEALPLWKRGSAEFAQGATRRADVFLNGLRRPDGVWATVEKPILQANGVTITTHLVVLPN